MERLSRLWLFEQDNSLATDMTSIESMLLGLRKCKQSFTTTVFLLWTYLMLYLESLGPRAFRITEHMQCRNVERFNEAVCLLEVCLFLATSTHDNINPNESMRHERVYRVYLGCKQSRIVTTTHKSKHSIATCLKRYMEVGHESTRTGNKLNYLISQQIGFNRRNPITSYTLYLIKSTYKVNECLTCRLSEITDIDSRNNNLLGSFSCSLASLLHKRSNSSVATASTSIRDCTIGTEIVAPILHLEKETGAVSLRAGGYKGANILSGDGEHFAM